MASGWARDGAIQEQIDASVNDAVQYARSNLISGASAELCDECDEKIPQARRLALPGVRYCISCQAELEGLPSNSKAFNRRGSKDSQLR
ncbi:DksA/TraR family C4-type zinc finger protein [Pseudoalteromonas sp. PS1M3]|jgi:phage/conjugal plasmid C-4 type zinc finger TraR family protein|uniref:DksA/TraR family C4-type zinc finger protein n=1 Tax=Pseudoalteromonas TaxID=53246 RepID=UPI001950ED5C|nr:DksA/TraR family C4-type zinc finger protein [Pseudoalteromonas sp. PS1M3]BBW91969.1 DksA/TraR family C4-type zinc finger protein [Pseudoalteromonas sp. PS1M3]